MKTKWPDNPVILNTLLVAFSLAVFAVDTLTPLGAVEWISYALPIFVAARLSRTPVSVLITLLCTVLIALGFVYSPRGGMDPSIALGNRLAVTAVLWVTATVLILHKRSSEALEKAEGEVEAKTKETVRLTRDKAELVSEIEAQKLIERQRSDFFSMVTHDLKSPLGVISGYVELLLEKKGQGLDPQCAEIAAAIRKSSEKLLGMVEEFLDASKLETGSAVLNETPVDPEALLREAADGIRPVASKRGIEISLTNSPGLPNVMMDRKYVERAVTNLVSNAVSYTQEGGRVTIAASVSGGFLELSVSDNGPGIPERERERIFDKFYRASGSSGMKGSGLGLAIVKGVAEAHGGRVELESAAGSGSTFRMLIPVSR